MELFTRADLTTRRPRHRRLTAVPFWTDQVVPRFTDKMLGSREVMKLRRRAVDSLAGDVVEIGFGSGLNVPLYPAEVTHVYAVDPSLVGRKLSQERVDASPVRVEFVGLDGAHAPARRRVGRRRARARSRCARSPTSRARSSEVRRVLRPGGTFHFLEHGLCPDPGGRPEAAPLQRHAAASLRRLPPRPSHRRARARGRLRDRRARARPDAGPEVHAAVGLPLRGRRTDGRSGSAA